MLVAVASAGLGCGGEGGDVAERNPERALVFEREPYMGVACRRPNSIACDRVGLAVWLETPAKRLTASIAGRDVRMRTPGDFVAGRGSGWEGYLYPAGFDSGPLEVEIDARGGRWVGREPVYAPVRVTAYYGDGSSATKTTRVGLRPGWG